MSHIIYLACPYSHDDPAVVEYRVNMATKAVVHIANHGFVVYSPLTMTHPMHVMRPQSHEFWLQFDRPFMEICTELMILRLDGWQLSKGIERELQHFRLRNKRVTYLDPKQLSL
jgi:hypothetical protein